MVGAHQTVNDSRDLTTPLSGMVCHLWLALATINLLTKFKVSIATHHKDIKGDTQYQKWDGLGSLGITQGHWK